MRTLLLAGLFLAGSVAFGDDLAWKFDTSNRPADVVLTSTAEDNPEAADLRGPTSGASNPIALFDSRWRYMAAFGYFEYRFRPGIYFIVR